MNTPAQVVTSIHQMPIYLLRHFTTQQTCQHKWEVQNSASKNLAWKQADLHQECRNFRIH